MTGWFADLRAALRLCRRQPGLSLFAILALAFGIGGATAVFTLVQAVLLRALPFREPDRLVWMYNLRTERDRAPLSIPDLDDYRRDNSTLEGLAPFTNWTANLTGTGEAERLEGMRVSGAFFPLVGPNAFLGRTLEPRDEAANAKVAVLTHGLWMRRFGGDPALVGRQVILNGAGHVVVGILPPGFVFPFRYAEVAVPLPLRDDPRRTDRGANFLRVVARLRSGVSRSSAKADLDIIARRLQQQYPVDDARKIGVSLYLLHAEIVSDYRQLLWTLFGSVGVLLLVGCGNLATLLLVRASSRRVELGVRESLGASRGRIARLLTMEAVVLAAAGGTAGIAVAEIAIVWWRSAGPSIFPRMADVALDGRILVFAAALTALAALVCGIVPAWCASRDLTSALTGAGRTFSSGRRQAFVRRAFVGFQTAAAAALLVCMGLVARGFARLERVDPGFTPDRAVSVQLSLPPARYGSRDALARFYDALRLRVRSIPGVDAAGAVSLMPLGGLLSTIDIAFPDRPAPPPDQVPQAHLRIASPEYFAAAGVAVVDGRAFADDDNSRGRAVAIVSRTFAERHFPARSAVGQHVQIVQTPAVPLMEIVGVVKDVKQFDLDGPATADLYVPIYQMPASQAAGLAARMFWVIRTGGSCVGAPSARPSTDSGRTGGQGSCVPASAIRQAVLATDPDVAASSVRSLDEVLSTSLAARHTTVRLLEIFGALGIVLSAVGVYAVAAFSAGGRRRELAVRSAFGANPRALTSLMMREELGAVIAGLAVGLLAALVAAPSLSGVMFATSPRDPATYIVVAAVLFAVGTAANYVPARRAATADPAELLRH